MKFTYLLLNLFTIAVPFIRSFEPRIKFNTKWKYFFPANLFTFLFFIIWDYYFTEAGVWSFNDQYLLGVRLFGLPIEELMFFFTVPYACTFIYEAVILYISKRVFKVNLRMVFIALGVVCFGASFFFLHQAYTFSVLSIGGVLFALYSKLLGDLVLERMSLAYLISLIPMLIVNGILTALPVVIYNNTQNTSIRLGTIPIEDFLYSAILLFMNIGIYALLMQRDQKKG